MIKVAVPGIKGRMGCAIAKQVLQSDDLELALVTAKDGDPIIGSKFENTDLTITADLAATKFAVLIDFTSTIAVMHHLDFCLQNNIPMVIGVTGFDDLQLSQIKAAATKIPIVLAANMSIGVNICYKILENATKLFDDSWQINIFDLHHQHKKDSPSGTAKQLAKVIANAKDVDESSINIKSERYGDVAGSHAIAFFNESESITITHVANNRDIFAKGSVSAARWLHDKAAGLYSMQDVIALN